MEQNEKKNDCYFNLWISGILFICYLVVFILTIIWVFKVHSNAKSEPKLRSRYIIEGYSTYYIEDEFCYDYYELFLTKGALDIFDIPMSKIRKFCKALISTFFISIGLAIIIGVLSLIVYKKKLPKSCSSFIVFLIFIFLLSIILSIIFSIILMHYYSKGNYSDFEEFSRCRYLSKKFRKDYDFVFRMKNEYKLPYAIIIITEFFSFIKLIVESIPTDNDS